jgi:DNA repair protein RadC
MQVKNVGINCAGYLNVLGRIKKLSADAENPMPKLFNFYDFKIYLKERFKSIKTEEFIIFFLDKRHKIINEWKCTNDDDSMVKLDLKNVTKLLSINKPYSIVAAHNHISGIEKPTKNDDTATGGLALILNLNQVQFYDHIIIAGNNAYSYHLSGKLDEIMKNFNLKNLTENLNNGGLET